jgi:hypothetical protein
VEIRFIKKHRLLLILMGIVVAMACSFTAGTFDQEAQMAATSAYYEQRATQWASGLVETWTALPPSRTAVALTRQPELAISATLHPLELTGTAIPALTAANLTPLPGVDTWALTATQVVGEITQTSVGWETLTAVATSPSLALTETAVVHACSVKTEGMWQPRAESNIGMRLNTALNALEGQPGAYFREYTYPVSDEPLCRMSAVIETRIIVQLYGDVFSPPEITASIIDVLAVLARDFPRTSDYGLRTQLEIDVMHYERFFYGDNAYSSIPVLGIETDYQNALDAYNEGLRGAALIEALGGWIPGWQD